MTLPHHDIPAPARLYRAILERVAYLRRRNALLRAGALALTALLSAIGTIEMALYTWNEAYLSGFIEYVRLLISDSDVALGSWHTFAYSLLESAPALPSALVCAMLLILIWSLARITSNMRVALRHAAA